MLSSTALWISLSSAAVSSGDFDAGERAPIALLLIMNATAVPTLGRSQIEVAADAAVRRYTGFEVLPEARSDLDTDVLAECAGRPPFTCWGKMLRRHELRGEPLVSDRGRPRFLLIVAAYRYRGPAEEEADLISTSLLDTDVVLELASRSELSAEDIEDKIFNNAVATSPFEKVTAASIEAYFDGLIRGQFSAMLRESRDGAPPGRLSIEGVRAGLEIMIDRRPVGIATASSVRVAGVRAGERLLTLRAPRDGVDAWTSRVEVRGNEETHVVVAEGSVALGDPSGGTERIARRIGGAALVLAGIGLVTYGAAANPRGRLQLQCEHGDCGRATELASFCDYGAGEGGGCSGLSTILVVPLGLGVATAGGLALIGGELEWFGERPWLNVLLGVVAGVAVYGIGAVAGN